jgi:hypothetical protein
LPTAPHRFDKEHLAHFIGKNGGVKNGAKKKYPEVLSTGNKAAVPPLQNGCNIADRNVFSSPIVFQGKDSFAWLDPEAGKNTHMQGFRLVAILRFLVDGCFSGLCLQVVGTGSSTGKRQVEML